MGSDTTAPADETSDAPSKRVLAIRWIFPGMRHADTRLSGARALLGRSTDCDAHLPSHETSRQHAEIRREGPIWVLRDLDSRNGTFLNGQRITSAPLSPRDLVRVGDWIGLVTTLAGDSLPEYESFAPGLYAGPALRPALDIARRAAPSLLPLVVEGETGTGKEGLSRTIHTWSNRRGPFLAVNCGALPETLAEGELFGYRKGAFTGAERANLGYFRAADGGTLLLDEITDLPLALQTKLLRVLEQREVVPLGESAPIKVDVRVLAAAQERLEQAVADKRFRPDLCARLNGLTIRLPPLRERVEEIPFLFLRLLADHADGPLPRVDARVVERLCLYDWPFNVRELDLLVRRLWVLDTDRHIRKAHLPESMLAPRSSNVALAAPGATVDPDRPKPSPPRTREERVLQDEHDLAALVAGLRSFRGNVARAAAAVGVSRQRAYRLMERWGQAHLDELRAESGPVRAKAKRGED